MTCRMERIQKKLSPEAAYTFVAAFFARAKSARLASSNKKKASGPIVIDDDSDEEMGGDEEEEEEETDRSFQFIIRVKNEITDKFS